MLPGMSAYGPFLFGGEMARIVWHESGFVGIDLAIVEFMHDLGERVEKAAEALAPVDTGALKASISLEMAGKTAYISANTFYALYQEIGAGPHDIDGNPWLDLPNWPYPVKDVDHPGNPAVHYLLRALFAAAAGG